MRSSSAITALRLSFRIATGFGLALMASTCGGETSGRGGGSRPVQLASIAQAERASAEARKAFDEALLMWDGEGFNEAAARHSGIYATYKLALYLIAAERLKIAAAPHKDEVIVRLLAMQASDGGWITDYKKGKAIGVANVETTCLSLLALQSLRK